MSPTGENNGRPRGSEGAQGVLANLPRTRPQRSTARRVAARRQTAAATQTDASESAATGAAAPKPARKAAAPAGAAKTAAKARTAAKASAATRGHAKANGAARTTAAARTPAKAKPAARRAAAPRATAAPRRAAAGVTKEHVPLQGFESEMDRARGPVEPPGGTELVAGAAEIIGELARAGLSTGERLVRDALSRLPL